MALTSRRTNFEDSNLARRLRKELGGEVLFDRFSRGRYSTDASIYQVEPIGVVIPRCEEDVTRAVEIAAAEDVPVLPRGGGTSQCGQTVGRALVIDTSKYLRGILDLDIDKRTICVQPGLVLDNLNRSLRPHNLFFPVDPSTASRATIGGMAGNNSCGARSVQYGNMIHNVRAVDAVLADGETIHFGVVPGDLKDVGGSDRYRELIDRMRSVAARESGEIARRFPKLLRRVGGYNIDSIGPDGHNMAHLLIGSEGTLAFFTRVYLDLQPLPAHTVLG
ncbi:MAG: FAD-binding oxidoreductase, partial [Alphaproteobacteria bacterium]